MCQVVIFLDNVKNLQCKNDSQKCKINVPSHKFSFGTHFKQNKKWRDVVLIHCSSIFLRGRKGFVLQCKV